jgi:hypothetical protein
MSKDSPPLQVASPAILTGLNVVGEATTTAGRLNVVGEATNKGGRISFFMLPAVKPGAASVASHPCAGSYSWTKIAEI